MNQLYRLLSQCLNTSEVKLNISSNTDNLKKWDSLAIINIAISLEEEYKVSLTAEDVEQLKSVKAIVEVLARHKIAIDN